MTTIAEKWAIGAGHPVPARARLRQAARQFTEWADRLGRGIDQGSQHVTAEQAQTMRGLLGSLMQSTELNHLTDLVEDLAHDPPADPAACESFNEWSQWVNQSAARSVSVPDHVGGVETGPGVTVWDGQESGPAGWCGDCGGTGGRLDVDGSLTGQIGRPVACYCLGVLSVEDLDQWRQLATETPNARTDLASTAA